ncbi:MAG TPA: hypothetical protein VMC43_01115, partial [Candidatus Paceibacterota bacterium]|nr:hypothetical protein [Candidatus Paceibacterota bacterium]
MTTSELKKFISGFLLSAVGVAASAFLFLNQAAQSVNEPAAQQVSDTAPTTPTNAFQEPLPPEATPPAPTGQPPVNLLADTLGTSTATDTLTARLIIALGQEISRTNPNGPTVVDGESGIASPDINSIIAAVTQDPSITKVKIPDWESEIVFKYQPHVIAGANPSDIANYKKEIGDFYQRYSETSVPTPDPTSLTPFDPTSLPIPQALADAQSIPTPEPFAKLQWDLIKTIAYQNKAIDLIKIADTDPVGASVIMQVQEANYLATLDDLQQESQKAVALGILPGEAPLPGIVSLVNGLLGIKTAHAQFEVNDLTKLARNIWQYIKKFITAKLKDLLVHKLVMQTIQWIQGGGKPQFVTNWKGFMENTAKNAAGQMIDQIYPKLCTSFAPLIRVAAIPVNPSRDLNTLPVCTIDRVVQNVQNFARSFETGGWIAYGAAMQPSNNLIGSIV